MQEQVTLNRQESAAFVPCSERTISRYVESGRIQGVQRVGRELLIPKSELERIRKEREEREIRAGGAAYARRFAIDAYERLKREDAAAISAASSVWQRTRAMADAVAMQEAVAVTLDYSPITRLFKTMQTMEQEAVQLAEESEHE